jgi:hypothetical protein
MLNEALAQLPGLAGRRWRADAKSRSAYWGALKKKQLLPARHQPEVGNIV